MKVADGQLAVVVPLMDLVNHDYKPNAKLECLPGNTGSCALVSIDAIAPGEEIRWTYTYGSNVTFLSIWGFAPRMNTIALAISMKQFTPEVTELLKLAGCSDVFFQRSIVTFSLQGHWGIDEFECMRLLTYSEYGVPVSVLRELVTNSSGDLWGDVYSRALSDFHDQQPDLNEKYQLEILQDCTDMADTHTTGALDAAEALTLDVSHSPSQMLGKALIAEVDALRRCISSLRAAGATNPSSEL